MTETRTLQNPNSSPQTRSERMAHINERLKTVVPGNTLTICPKCGGFGEASGDLKYTCHRCDYFPITVKDHASALPLPEGPQQDEKAFARPDNPSGISDADPRGDDSMPWSKELCSGPYVKACIELYDADVAESNVRLYQWCPRCLFELGKKIGSATDSSPKHSPERAGAQRKDHTPKSVPEGPPDDTEPLP